MLKNKQKLINQLKIQFSQINIALGWVVVLLTLLILVFNLTGCGKSPEAIIDGEPFEPTQDATIAGGEYFIPSMSIPEDINVHFEGDVNLIVDGDVEVAGVLQGQCTGITMKVEGAFILTGDLDNTGCEEEETADITLNLAGDQPIQLGQEGHEITTEGNLFINIGDVEGLESTPPLPFIPAQESTPPVCTLSTDNLVTDLTEEGLAYIPLWGECLDPDGGNLQTFRLKYKLMSTDEWIYEPDSSDELFNEGDTTLILNEPGVHLIYLEAEDDESDTSFASHITVYVRDPTLEEPNGLGIVIDQSLLFYEQGGEVQLESIVESTLSESELKYQWQIYFKDAWVYSTSDPLPIINLEQPGVIHADLYLYWEDEWIGFASTSFYVAAQEISTSKGSLLAKPKMVTQYNCTNPPENAIVFNGIKFGKNLIARVLPVSSQPIMILPPALIMVDNGQSHFPKNEANSYVEGKNGGNGGSILIHNWNGDIVVCNGAAFILGSGGNGQSVTADPGEGRSATAIGGNGGKPGTLTLITDQFHESVIESKGTPAWATAVTIEAGDGGNGGNAEAIGGKGKEDCNAPTQGRWACAWGGRGGNVNYTVRFSETRFSVGGSINILGPGGGGNLTGGAGGNAIATGGDGGNAANPGGAPPCNSCMDGKNSGEADAIGGKGGSAYLSKFKVTLPITPPNMKGGKGGNATSNGGTGGDASDCPNANIGKNGGKGGDASATVGKGGKGLKPADKGADGIVGGKAGNGGAGSKGLVKGGKGGDPGKGWRGMPNGNPGAEGAKIEAEVEATQAIEEATQELQGQGTPPVITAVEFISGNMMDPIANERITLPADGTEFDGWIHFEDADGDARYISFEPMEADSKFQGFSFYLYEGTLEGDTYDGKIQFYLWCGIESTQQQVTLSVTMQDASGNWSDPALLALYCE